MGFELTPAFWSGLTQIILVNIVLSGDNALVIALACRNLEKRHQKPAILASDAHIRVACYLLRQLPIQEVSTRRAKERARRIAYRKMRTKDRRCGPRNASQH